MAPSEATVTAGTAPRSDFQLENVPPAPERLHAILDGAAGAERIRRSAFYVTFNYRWNPLLWNTKIVWYAGGLADADTIIPELQWRTDWSNLEAEPPSIAVLNYEDVSIRAVCRCCQRTYVYHRDLLKLTHPTPWRPASIL